MQILVLLLLCVLCPSPVFAQAVLSGARGGSVSVTSSTQAVQVTDRIKKNVKVGVPSDAASAVCVFFLDNGTACSTITSSANYIPCIPANGGWEFGVNAYQWEGQICAILETGSTPVTLQWRDPW